MVPSSAAPEVENRPENCYNDTIKTKFAPAAAGARRFPVKAEDFALPDELPPSDVPPESPLPSSGNGDHYEPLNIEEELKDSYLTYAMSVIISRALPDVRDGLKPSQRRILMAMNDLGLGPASATSKCAGIIGETMKRYHPHGDASIYMTLVHL